MQIVRRLTPNDPNQQVSDFEDFRQQIEIFLIHADTSLYFVQSPLPKSKQWHPKTPIRAHQQSNHSQFRSLRKTIWIALAASPVKTMQTMVSLKVSYWLKLRMSEPAHDFGLGPGLEISQKEGL